ncbi:MAG TPA: hypothetical protein VEA63_13205 [Opitutus sp.]|nr:hypothetical protein [Opitutus sp.]
MLYELLALSEMTIIRRYRTLAHAVEFDGEGPARNQADCEGKVEDIAAGGEVKTRGIHCPEENRPAGAIRNHRADQETRSGH